VRTATAPVDAATSLFPVANFTGPAGRRRAWNSLLSALPVGALLATGFIAAQITWALLW
jgi:hypothetical protein